MPPGVATRPRPSITAVEVSSTMSIASIVSGFPARPTATTRPSVTPMLVRRTPSTGSSSRTSVIASATPPRSERTARPSRIVPPMPRRCRSASSRSGSTSRPESPSCARSSGTEIPPLARQLERPSRAPGSSSGPSTSPPWPRTMRSARDRHAVQVGASRPARNELLTGREREPEAVHGRAVGARSRRLTSKGARAS